MDECARKGWMDKFERRLRDECMLGWITWMDVQGRDGWKRCERRWRDGGELGWMNPQGKAGGRSEEM